MTADRNPYTTYLNLDEVKPWLQQCGSCDVGLPMPCTHSEGDYRVPMAALVAEVERLRAERAAALRLIRDLTDDDDCWFDHHGGGQAHGYLSLGPGEKCPQQEAKELIAANEETTR